jgi:predicted transcriptional regulator
LDEVGLSLLVAAKHEQLLYDISRWGEDTGVASKATFSRTKTHLEEQGLIETEKVPIDVGRPRLRLILGNERLREAGTEELSSVARELLSAAPA